MALAGTVEQVSSSDESSDDDDNPLSSLVAVCPSVLAPARLPVSPAVHPPQAEPLPVVPTRDFSDDDEDQTSIGELLSKAVSTIGNTTDVSYY